MISQAQLSAIVMRANLAPSVHNTQPARWRKEGDEILIGADRSVILETADPLARDAGLSCGAAVEATVLALGDLGFGAKVTDTWQHNDLHSWRGHRLAARLRLTGCGDADPLALQLDHRFTWRGVFAADDLRLYGWSRSDAVMVLDAPTRDWLAGLNDVASLQTMRNKAFRRELLIWMRLSDKHPRMRFDGLSRAALQMDRATARAARLALGPLWGVCDLLGATRGMTAEADKTRSAPLIVCFHRPVSESPVSAGRAYLRMWLEATNLGLAGWPMAALSDEPQARAKVAAQFGIGSDRQLVQVIRLGQPTGPPPVRARRALGEVLK